MTKSIPLERPNKLKISDFEGNGSFIDRPAVSDRASEIILALKKDVSDARYAPRAETLNFHWEGSLSFRAAARIDATNADDHEIVISYGAVFDLYKDAFIFSQICSRHLTTDHYKDFFPQISPLEELRDVIPDGLSADDAKLAMFETSIVWLYLHEQAHLFQKHSVISSRIGRTLSEWHGAIEEISIDDEKKHTERAAAFSHVIELMADHEATCMTFQYLIRQDNGSLRMSSIWLLVAGLMCMFQRFYGEERGPAQTTAEGTHPNPAFRMSMATQFIQELLATPAVAKYAQWATPEIVFDVVNHATICASIFWKLRYDPDGSFPEFMREGLLARTPESYRRQIFDMWLELFPTISTEYFGWGGAALMDLKSWEHIP